MKLKDDSAVPLKYDKDVTHLKHDNHKTASNSFNKETVQEIRQWLINTSHVE